MTFSKQDKQETQSKNYDVRNQKIDESKEIE